MRLKSIQCKVLICASVLLMLPAVASADFLSFTAGGGIWSETPSGSIRRTVDATNVDLRDNLFLNKKSQGYLFADIKHAIPLVPNIRVMYTKLDHSGSGTTIFKFNNLTFSNDVVSNVQIKTLDVIAYYQLMDNVVDLDLGLNIRKIDLSYIFTSSTGISTSNSIRQVFPMLYALVGASPWPGLKISADISYVAYSGNSISDMTAKIAYTTSAFVGFEAGYRRQNFKLNDIDSTNANVTFAGPFVGGYLKF